ncbi:hypothetical protein THAOC_22112, partial [Thalassiosira oceanica]
RRRVTPAFGVERSGTSEIQIPACSFDRRNCGKRSISLAVGLIEGPNLDLIAMSCQIQRRPPFRRPAAAAAAAPAPPDYDTDRDHRIELLLQRVISEGRSLVLQRGSNPCSIPARLEEVNPLEVKTRPRAIFPLI